MPTLTVSPRYALACGCSIHVEDQDDATAPALSFRYCSRHGAADTIYGAARNLVRSAKVTRDGSGDYTVLHATHHALVMALLEAVDGNRARIYAPEKAAP